MTGLGVYYYLVFLEYLRINLLGRKEQFHFIWEYGVFPHIDRLPATSATARRKKKV